MTHREVKLLIVDDHPVFRRGLRQIIEEHPCFKIIGEAGDGESGLQLAVTCQPDIAVVDIDMPGRSGFDMARALRKMNSPVKVAFSDHVQRRGHL